MGASQNRVVFTLVLALTVALAGPAAAGPPTDQLRTQIERVLKALEDPALKKEGLALQRRKAVRKIADDIFDFGETAKRSLA
ncbi:MAG: hypothetical protein ACRDH5_08800, partial [bacterium]